MVLLAVELELNVIAVLILLDETLFDDDDFFFALDMLRSLTTDIWIYVQPEVQRTKDTKSVIPR